MKKLKIITVGRIKEDFFLSAEKEYLKRLKGFCDPEVIEVKDFPPEKRDEECEGIIEKLKGFVILTAIEGKLVTSEDFSRIIDKAYLGADTVSVVIGGSTGVNDKVRAAADETVSFGRVTYPHRLMRVIVAEQIYRAFTIKQGLPYHK